MSHTALFNEAVKKEYSRLVKEYDKKQLGRFVSLRGYIKSKRDAALGAANIVKYNLLCDVIFFADN